MKKTLLVALVFLTSTASAQESTRWTYFAENEEVKIYVDNTTLKRVEDVVRAWVLFDYRQPVRLNNGVTYKSQVARNEYRCNEQESRSPNLTIFSGPMSKGKSLGGFKDADANWEPVIPGSVAEGVLRYVCRL